MAENENENKETAKRSTRKAKPRTESRRKRNPALESMSRRDRRSHARRVRVDESVRELLKRNGRGEGLRELKVGDRLNLVRWFDGPADVAFPDVEIVGETDKLWKLDHGIRLSKDTLATPRATASSHGLMSAHPDSLAGQYLAATADVRKYSDQLLESAVAYREYRDPAGADRESWEDEVVELRAVSEKLDEALTLAFDLVKKMEGTS